MNGGEALVETLVAWGIEAAFAVPGESYLPVLAALQRRANAIRLVTPRHESGVTFACAAYGRIAGKPSVGLVSRGPGSTNASIGLHVARQDSVPMLLVIGDVPTASKGREAFQEIDYHNMFSGITKAVLEPASAAEVPAKAARALELAMAGRPGPVVLVMPKDISDGEAGTRAIPPPTPREPLLPDQEIVTEAARRIDAAERPVIIAGELIAFEDVEGPLTRFAEASGAAVTAAYRCQDALSNNKPVYIGHLEINRADFQEQAWEEADLVVAAGARLDGITTRDFSMIRDNQTLIHIHPDAEVLARWSSDVAIRSDTGPALAALADAVSSGGPGRREWRAELNGAYRRFSEPGGVPVHGRVDLAAIAAETRRQLPPDAVVITDSGTFARWVHRYFRFEGPRTQAGPMAGAMGYGVPGGIGAALARPGPPVVVFAGDGGFLMTGQEAVTLLQERLPVKIVVCDNSAWGSILTSQQTRYGEGGIFGTRLDSPDFEAVGRAYGLHASRVRETAAFAGALGAALAYPGPALIHLELDERDISPFTGASQSYRV
ncbi:MAG: thiamine pyrophosphate-binding protein [Alphaproteobacteria bacterium]|nr:thiamine pyrophosphate-binding protein [Alphaproteobacteria bacterium]